MLPVFYVFDSDVTLSAVNCDFVSNQTDHVDKNVIKIRAGETPDVTVGNSIVWGNTTYTGGSTWSDDDDLDAGVTVDFTLIDVDPLFVRDPSDSADTGSAPDGDCDEDGWGDPPCPSGCGTECDDYGDLHLDDCSPAIDYGDNDALPTDDLDCDGDTNTTEIIPCDLDGNDRRYNDTGVTDCAGGACDSSPVVDRGAYERQTNSTGCQ